jgi:predicted TIM-barrel fold metal-dependent hydrolase
MIVDVDRHVTVSRYEELFAHMPLSWRKHFEREEWLGSVTLGADHVRVSDRFRNPAPGPLDAPAGDGSVRLLLPHQGLGVNGWSDHVAARTFLHALNGYVRDTWAADGDRPVIVVSPHDPEWSATEIRERARDGDAGAVALPLAGPMLGASFWDPVYEACVEAGLPVVVHFSGVEGRYLGSPPLSGGAHMSALSRMTLMPHLAESSIASLTFEGALVRHPDLRILFTGFGFTWLPSLLWRLDREWRTFRHDVPWVTEPPSRRVLAGMWFSTWPMAEVTDTATWAGGFTDELRTRIVFGSHAPHDGDSAADVDAVIGAGWSDRLRDNGSAALGLPLPAGGPR